MKQEVQHTDERPFFNETPETKYVTRSEYNSLISELKSALIWIPLVFALIFYFNK